MSTLDDDNEENKAHQFEAVKNEEDEARQDFSFVQQDLQLEIENSQGSHQQQIDRALYQDTNQQFRQADFKCLLYILVGILIFMLIMTSIVAVAKLYNQQQISEQIDNNNNDSIQSDKVKNSSNQNISETSGSQNVNHISNSDLNKSNNENESNYNNDENFDDDDDEYSKEEENSEDDFSQKINLNRKNNDTASNNITKSSNNYQ